MFVYLFILTALLSTLYSGQKSLILFIIATCVIVTVLLSALIIFQKRKSFKKCHAKKKVHFTSDSGFFSYFFIFLWMKLEVLITLGMLLGLWPCFLSRGTLFQNEILPYMSWALFFSPFTYVRQGVWMYIFIWTSTVL